MSGGTVPPGGPARGDSGAGDAPRLAWVDVARGIAIALVVLFHAVMYQEVGADADRWPQVTALLDTFRMPLFFAMSGLLAARATARPWPALLRGRILPLLYLYVVWSVLQTLWEQIVVQPPLQRPAGIAEIGGALVGPHPNLWFLLALAAYLAISRLVAATGGGWLVAIAAAVSVAAEQLDDLGDLGGWAKPLTSFVFFAAGLALSRRGLAVPAARIRAPLAVAFVLAYAAAVVFVVRPFADAAPALLVPVGLLALAAGIGVAAVLSRWRLARAPLAWLGRRTLPIYLLHPFVLTAVTPPLAGTGWLGLAPAAWPIALTALSIALSAAAGSLLAAVPGALAPPWRSRSEAAT